MNLLVRLRVFLTHSKQITRSCVLVKLPILAEPRRGWLKNSVATLIALIAFVLFVPGTSAQTTSVSTRLSSAVEEASLVSLPGNVHPLARPEFDQGRVDDAQPLRRMLLLLQRRPEQEVALGQLLKEQQARLSANYHSWLAPEQFAKQFGPSEEDLQSLMQWLVSNGFRDMKVSLGRTAIEFSGTAANVRQAFHTEIHRYSVNGEQHIANATDPQVPATLAAVVAGIASLHDFRKRPMYHLARNSRTAKVGTSPSWGRPEYSYPCEDFLTSIFGAFTGQSSSCHALGPNDFATIYNVLPLWNTSPSIDGTGQTIAIVGRSNINLQDVADFRSLFGLPPNPPQVTVDGNDPGQVSGDETEADLDVEWSGAVAKGATINLVVSQSTETTDGVDLSALYIVDHNLAPVMSTSFGQCEFYLGTAGNQFYYNLWQQAAAQGITALVSTGDNGSAGCDSDQGPGPQPAQDGLQVNGLASTPYNIAVGGTDFNDYFDPSPYWNSTSDATTLESAKSYIPEVPWNDSCTNAFLENPVFHLTSSPETNCNNADIATWFAFPVGGSGGKSSCTSPSGTGVAGCAGGYAKPVWQMASNVPNDGKRDLPDVSLFSGSGMMDSFYMVCQSDLQNASCSTSAFVGVGGTSASAPTFAALLALVNQKMGSRQGSANYVLYGLAAKQSALNCNSTSGPAAGCVFNDITSGTIAMPCTTGSQNCTTTSASDNIGILSGYQASSGYDQATGLGSVNAANLINGWNSVAAGSASTTSLTLNGGTAVNVTHGTQVNVAISVSPTSPEPTGLASLVATQGSESFGLDSLTVNDGTASGATTMLPGGASYNVLAHYAGDANYAGSDSNAVTVTVTPEASATNVHVATVDLSTGQVSNANATSIPYGSLYVLRADVTNASGATCFNPTSGAVSYTCPTGTVSFALDGNSLGSGPSALNSEGYTENQSVQLTGGSHSFKGSYSGDNSYFASAATDAVTVVPAATITGTQTLYPMPIGVSVGFSVAARTNNLGSYGVPMSGTFTILDGGNPVSLSEYTLTGVIYPAPCSPCPPNQYVWETLDGEITATFSGLPGIHTLTVNYSGDNNYAPSSTTASANLVYPTQTTLSSSAPTIQDGQPVTFTAQIVPAQTVSSPPSGNVAFNINGSLQTVAVSNNQAQLTVSTLYAGNVPITATYSGDSNYGASTGTFTETVTQVSTTTSLTSSSATVTDGGEVTFTAQITPSQTGAAPLTGTVQFTANGALLGGVSVSNNQAKLSPFLYTVGSLQIQASYSGDQNYSASSGTFTETVTPPPPDFSMTALPPTVLTVPAGQTAGFTVSVSAVNGFASQVTLSCSLPASATTCLVSPTSLPSGSGTVTVTVTTTARSALPFSPQDVNFYLRAWQYLLPLGLFLSLLLARFIRPRLRWFWQPLPFAFAGILFILGIVACGGGGSGSGGPPPPPPPTGTPQGTYTITVTGVSGSTTHSTSLTLTVN